MKQTTLFDIPVGPFTIEIKCSKTDFKWVVLRQCTDEQEGLYIVSVAYPYAEYRLFLGEGFGYKYFEWVDDPDDSDLCLPKWVEK